MGSVVVWDSPDRVLCRSWTDEGGRGDGAGPVENGPNNFVGGGSESKNGGGDRGLIVSSCYCLS